MLTSCYLPDRNGKYADITVILSDHSHFHGLSPKPPSRQYSPRLPSLDRYSRNAAYSLAVMALCEVLHDGASLFFQENLENILWLDMVQHIIRVG